jgi:zinc transport system permease protein
MGGFFQILSTEPFMQRAVLVGVLASLACAVIGTYVVVKRVTYISGGLSHALLGGIGVAYFLHINPMLGALAAALVAAAIIGLVSLHAGQHEDTTISAIWAVGMALGVMFMYMTPGYQQDLMSYLFGNILLVTPTNAWLLGALDALTLLAVLLFYKQLQALCFDEEFTLVQGVRVDAFYMLLLGLTALTIVVLVQVVGVILVIALLTLPAATAHHYARSLRQMMLLALIVGVVCTFGGLAISYPYNLPPGATIVLMAGALYLLSTIFSGLLVRRLRASGGR